MGGAAEVYCGPAPEPETLAAAWNFDLPALLLCAAIAACAVYRGNMRTLPLAGGLTLLCLLFLSPLCALTAALFSARAAPHILLVAFVAPLLALAVPAAGAARIGIALVAGLHAVVFWFWHLPPGSAAAITDPVLCWTMQLSLLATGFWLWRRIFDRRESAGSVLLALLFTTVQMGMLGALLTFASAPLYTPHLLTTLPFGLTALQDQQLAGVLMWVPAALPYLAAALHRAWPLLAPSGSRSWSG